MILFRVSREAFLPFLIFSFFAGIVFGAVYDVFRIRRIAFARDKTRRVIKRVDAVIIFLEDVIFSLFIAVTMILICYKLYFGIPRWYSYGGAALGFFLWRVTAGKLVIKLADKIIAAISAFFAFILQRIITPPLSALKRASADLYERYDAKRRKRLTQKYEKRMLLILSGKSK